MNEINAIVTIALRDIIKLLRDKTRILANLVFPILFVGVLGTSMQTNLKDSLGFNFLVFVYTGVIAQTLFQSTASGIVWLIEDRQNDFAQELFVSPISRYSIIIGKILGETIISFIQTSGIILCGIILQVPIDFISLIKIIPFAILISLFGGSFGLLVMSNLDDQKSASQIFPFLLFPQFFLAGVFNLIKELPLPLLIASRLAPMTYAVDLIRSIYYFEKPEYSNIVLSSPILNLSVVSIFTIVFLILGTYIFVKKEKNK